MRRIGVFECDSRFQSELLAVFNQLLSLAHAIDRLTDGFGWLAKWAVLASCVISASNAVIRYFLNTSSNGWLEIQWYLFAACVMLGAAQVLRVNEHVRVDLFYGRLSSRGQVWVDLFGLVCFLLPVIGVMAWMTWDLFLGKFSSGEMSNNAGGLIRWPAVLMLPIGFGLVWLQALAEIVKRIGWLTHQYEMDTHYERPLQ
jgi:TRAP-type mannitol/chloroaromatic compound transport system permease small subunit